MQQYLPKIEEAPSPNQRNRPWGFYPTLLIVHATATAGWNSPFEHLRNPAPINWKTGKPDPSLRVSAHYLIGKDGRVARLVHTAQEAWHAGASSWPGQPLYGGSLNATSIGYELVNLNDGKDPYTHGQVDCLARLLAYDALTYKIPIDRHHIVGHYEVAPTRKTDPKGLNLDYVVNLTKYYAELMKNGVPVEQKTETWVALWRVPVRQAPRVTFPDGRDVPIAGWLNAGEEFEVDLVKEDGDVQEINGEKRWLHLANGLGFTWIRNARKKS